MKQTSSIEIKLKGHSNQYYVLKVFNDNGTIKLVHTSKNIKYLTNLRKQRGY